LLIFILVKTVILTVFHCLLCLQADSDGDGYLSCFQVLLALKEIIPPELLTEEEEIYVYRVNAPFTDKYMI